MRRVVVIHRVTLRAPNATVVAHLKPPNRAGQRLVLFDFECDPQPQSVVSAYDDHGNAIVELSFGTAPSQCTLTATSDLIIQPRLQLGALDRPWEHAIVERIRTHRRVEPLALRCASEPRRAFATHARLADVVNAASIEALTEAGLAVCRVYGYRLDEPSTVHAWHALYTPDCGWFDLDRSTKIAVASTPLGETLAVTADPDDHRVVELDVVRRA